MIQIYLYAGMAFSTGFTLAWIIRTFKIARIKKALKSTQGYLESEILKKETLQKENVEVYQKKQISELDCIKKLSQIQELNKILDNDILLLQKSNEETEALLQAGQPEIYSLKLQLFEAQNIIARFKALQH